MKSVHILLLLSTIYIVFAHPPSLPPYYIGTIDVSQEGRSARYRGVFMFDSTARRWRLDVAYSFSSNSTLIYVDSVVFVKRS